jgi:hypothetical protein
MQAGLSTKNAPSPKVVVPHYAFGAISLLVALIMLFFASADLTAHYLSPKLLSVTHMLVLGWITMIIFGALYQLIPVVMEVKLYSEKLAVATFVLFGIGLIVLSYSFWSFNFGRSIGLEIGGFMIIISMIMFGINTILSAQKTERKTIENTFIITAIVWLLIAVTIGILIVLNFGLHFISGSHLQLLKMHAHIGVIGWFLLLVIGVSSKLMPMFLIVHKLPRKLLNVSYVLVNTGLLLLASGYYFFNEIWFLASASGIIIAGIVAFLRFNYIAFTRRIRKKLDIGMKLSATGFILLAISILFGIISVLSPEITSMVQTRIEITYGILIILGFLTSLVLGQTYKTLPFIIWLKKYQSKVGKTKVPLPMELYSDKIANYHFYTFIAGILLLVSGILFNVVLLIKAGIIILIITALLYNYNVFKIIFHENTSNEPG